MVSKGQAVLFLFIMVFFVLLTCLGFQTLSSILITEDLSGNESNLIPVVPTMTIAVSSTPPPSATPTPVQVAAPSPVVIADTPTPVMEQGPEVALTATTVWETILTPQASVTPTQTVSEAFATSPPPPEATVPSGDYMFIQDGDARPDASQGCGTIYGLVRDADGSPLEGIRIWIDSEWTEPQVVETKGSIDGYRYNAIVSSDPGIVYSVVVVDEGGQPISPVAQVIRAEGEVTCRFEVNWRRTF